MARFGTFAAGLALLLLVGSAWAATHGSYLGCFDLNLMELSHENSKVVAEASGQASYSKCAKACIGAGYSMALIGGDYSCRCSGSVPPAGALLWDTECAAGGTGIAAFYAHTDPAAPCRVEDVLLSDKAFKPAYNSKNVKWESGGMQLVLAGIEGTRVQSQGAKNTYGMYQVNAQIPCDSGVVSAFYLRSSDAYADLNAGKASNDFDELDFEFLSHNGMPCSVWLNTFKMGASKGEVQMSQPQYQRALGWPSNKANVGSVTYTFNWQPKFVTWFMDGKPIKTLTHGEQTTINSGTPTVYEVPSLPMRPAFTMWTDTRTESPFGGHIDVTKGPYVASFSALRQVVCDANVPASATVPAWLA